MGRWLVLGILILIALGLWLGPRAQDFDFSARTTPPDTLIKLVQWAKTRSILYQSRGLEMPDPPPDALAALDHYVMGCMACHGGPGVPASLALKGMRPEPTDLTRDDLPWQEAQLFFIIRNGIMASGMPAYGPVLEDRQIWQLARLVKLLPQISPRAFQALIQSDRPRSLDRQQSGQYRPIHDPFFEPDNPKRAEHF